jgi:hypothetical protein
VGIDIDLDTVSPDLLALIGNQFNGLPMVIDKISIDLDNSSLRGTITTHILGS